jgi:hypothetical protein
VVAVHHDSNNSHSLARRLIIVRSTSRRPSRQQRAAAAARALLDELRVDRVADGRRQRRRGAHARLRDAERTLLKSKFLVTPQLCFHFFARFITLSPVFMIDPIHNVARHQFQTKPIVLK